MSFHFVCFVYFVVNRPMRDIVLTTLNAKYIHTAFGLRYLLANLGPLNSRAKLLEFDIKAKPSEVVEAVLAESPRIVGLGVYIWNVAPATEIVTGLKQARPDLVVVVGGPEVSFEIEDQEICRRADHVVAGEGDFAFADVCRQLLNGRQPPKIVHAEPVDVNQLALPYDLYDEDDIAHRMIYVEASRGCPYECEYCVSSHDVPVRYFPLPRLFEAFQRLLDRGAKQLKFVDRTFNVNIRFAVSVLDFLLARVKPGMQFHFEMVPDRFPPELREVIRRFPPGALRFEVGIQSFNPAVCRHIQRRQDLGEIDGSLRFLREAGAVVHADLIAGLPGESPASFAAGFDRLVALKPQEIQVGILKRLRGAPIGRHDAEWGMVYGAEPPYEILENKLIDRGTMDRIKRFARYWETAANSGNFVQTLPLVLCDHPFDNFLRLSDWLHGRLGRDHSIPLLELVESLLEYLTGELKVPRERASQALLEDYRRGGRRRDTPNFLR